MNSNNINYCHSRKAFNLNEEDVSRLVFCFFLVYFVERKLNEVLQEYILKLSKHTDSFTHQKWVQKLIVELDLRGKKECIEEWQKLKLLTNTKDLIKFLNFVYDLRNQLFHNKIQPGKITYKNELINDDIKKKIYQDFFESIKKIKQNNNNNTVNSSDI